MTDSSSGADARPLVTRLAFVPAGLRTSLVASALAIVAAVAIAYCDRTATMPSMFGPPRPIWLATSFFLAQDAPWLLAGALLLLVLGVARLPLAVSGWALRPIRHPGASATGLAILLLVVAIAGTYLVFENFHMARDEIMAEFDAAILRSGRLITDLPPEWRPFRRALVPDFLLPVPGAVAWVSAYLPGNAALRALVGLAVDPGVTNPILAAVAVLVMFDIARKLWPERPDAALVSVVLLATSSQLIVTAMTSYAMTAHLAFNLVWLRLFMRGGRIGHGGAIGIAFLACGLHQLIFHPLFAAPFILSLWSTGRRRLALCYGGAYALIGAFWILYWQLLLAGAGVAPDRAGDLGVVYFAVKVAELIFDFSFDGVMLMIKNTLRFVAWQNLMALPLALAALGAVRRDDGLARPLAAGIAFTFLAVFVLLPYQGHGWGYRYLHGLLGNVCLLGGYGCIAVTARATPREIAAAWSAVGLATAAAVALMLPVHATQAGTFIAPYRKAVEAIERAPTDIVIVDRSGLLFAADLVRNDPFLRNRPKVLDLTFLDEARVRDICARFSVSIFDRRQALPLGIPEDHQAPPEEEAARAKLRVYMAGLSCGTGSVAAPAASRAP